MNAEAEEAAAHWGGAASLRLIRARENAVYEAQLPTGRAALRLHRIGYQSGGAIRSELWWCAALADAGVAVARPVPAVSGALMATLSTGRAASVVDWVEGEPLGEAGVPLAGTQADQIARFAALGRLVGQLHAATDARTLPADFERPAWDITGLVGEAPFWGRFWDHPDLSSPERAEMFAARAWLGQRLSDYRDRGADFGLIHADVLRENVLVGRDGLVLIDFDDSGFGFRLHDLGTVLSQSLAEPALPALAAALTEGYAEVRPLDGAARAMVPVFTLARCCASVGWTIPRLPPGDPIRRRHIDRALALWRQMRERPPEWSP
ncbi:MAG: phosphotransferase enzyme family protein [Gemmobacter sp.]